MLDYAAPTTRTSKKGKKLKRRFRVYKRGGSSRAKNIDS